MKKLLLAAGILCIAICVLLLLFAALNLLGYHNVRDGSAELYDRLHQRVIVFFVAGLVFAVIGAVCIKIRSSM